MSPHRFHDLDQVIDQVHALFDAWTESGDFEMALDPEGMDVFRLAVHEWVANLVQHARFKAAPVISLTVDMSADCVHCSIEDSSAGFDFASQVETQKAVLDAPAPSERGRGLLMLVTCTEDLVFRAAEGDSFQHIAFNVRRSTASFLSSLFRPEDLADDFSLAEDLGLTDESFSFDDDIDFLGDGALGTPAPTPPPAAET